MKKENTVKLIGFKEAIRNFFAKYTDYDGTATRAEYWWVQLFLLLIIIGAGVFLLLGSVMPFLMIFSVVFLMFFVVMIIPCIMLGIRRMHDIGISGWWLFGIVLVETLFSKVASGLYVVNEDVAGVFICFAFCLSIINISLLCLPSVYENNKYRK